MSSPARGGSAAGAKPFDAGTPAAPGEEVAGWWADLAGDDAGRAYKAVFALAGRPEQAVALFGQKLRPAAAADHRRIAGLIDELGDGAATAADLKLCAYLRLNLSTKAIADLLAVNFD